MVAIFGTGIKTARVVNHGLGVVTVVDALGQDHVIADEDQGHEITDGAQDHVIIDGVQGHVITGGGLDHVIAEGQEAEMVDVAVMEDID